MKIFNWILLLFALASCYHAAPDPDFNMDLVIPADSMVTLMTDLHIIDGIISSLKSKKIPVGHLSSEYFEAVLRKHTMTREAFEESMRYYAFHAEELDKIYEKVITDLSKKESLFYPGQDSVKVVE
jgi:hypothetical protein